MATIGLLCALAFVPSVGGAARGGAGIDAGATIVRRAGVAASGCAADVAPVVCENAMTGAPRSQWFVGTNDVTVRGFARELGVQRGDTLHMAILTPAKAYRVEIYRLGYYGGLGARLVDTVRPTVALPQRQPPCLTDPSIGLIDCGNWADSVDWVVPTDTVSGVFLAKIVREDGTNGAGQIVFVVRDDDRASAVLVMTSDETWEAYNGYGGTSLYKGTTTAPRGRGYKVSYNRPLVGSLDGLFDSEYPMLRWLERNGYDTTYTSGVDFSQNPQQALGHRVMMLMGHDEYISRSERDGLVAARDAGVSLAFMGGNQLYWKTRWETSISADHTPFRTLVCYKESKGIAGLDPSPIWTGLWRDGSTSPPEDGGQPENSLVGTMFGALRVSGVSIQVPAAYSHLRFWRNTSIASMAPGDVATLAPETLGWEWDEDQDNGARPAGLFGMSATTVNVHHRVGMIWVNGDATHRLTLYRAASGALVFSAGAIRWSWGLDEVHGIRPDGTPADPRMQQATMNLLADMNVAPQTPQSELVVSGPSTDTTPPDAQFTVAAPTAPQVRGTPIRVSGTATDADGVVAGVEVSVDRGVHWHPATGTDSWSYSFTPMTAGTVAFMVRAVDDSGNLQAVPATMQLAVAAH